MSIPSNHRPPASPNSGAADVPAIDHCFDERPADPSPPPDFLAGAIANMARACEDAAKACQEAMAWVGERLGLVGAVPVVKISKPRNFKTKLLPQELREGIEAQHKAQAAREAKQRFADSADLPPAAGSPASVEEGEEAFNAYLKLRAQSGPETEAIACPQNFRDGAVKYAQGFVQRVADRKATAERAKKEFWLSPDDQSKYAAATELLEVEVKNRRPEAVKKAGPIATHSVDQYKSFYAWREWRKDATSLPADPDFSTDGALAYANTLVQQYEGKPKEAIRELKELLDDAKDLIASPLSLVELDSQLINALVEESRKAILARNGAQSGLRDAVDSTKNERVSPLGPPPPPPPPRMLRGDAKANPPPGSHAAQLHGPPAPPPPRVPATAKGEATPAQTGRTPPPPPPPRKTADASFPPAEWRSIPGFDTLADDFKVQGAVLLNRFFQEFSDQIEKGIPDLSKHPNDVLILEASAAVDFLKRAQAPNDGAAAIEPNTYAAASYLINEHLRRKNSQRGPGA